jgi:hypothetical protein
VGATRRAGQGDGVNKALSQPPRLGITTPDGATAWYRIIGVEAGSTGATKALTVAGGKGLDMGTYSAVLVDGGNRTAGSFAVLFCMSDTAPLRFVGTWTPAQ